MTAKQELFIEHYILDLNGTQSAIRAGYAVQYAGQQAHQLLTDPEIQAAIKARREKLGKESGIDIDWVTRKAQQIHDRCMGVEPVLIFDGESWVESGEYKFDSAGANKALDTIAKIVGAFEKDNDQSKQVITTPTINVYNTAPPLATDEKQVNV